MDEYSSYYRTYVNSGRNLEVIDGKAYTVSNVYVASSPSISVPSNNAFGSNKVSTRSRSRSWFNDPEIKRRKRIAQYKWYSVEGKVKVSLKTGFRWFRHTCRKIVRGF